MSTQNCPKCFFLNPAEVTTCERCGADLATAGDKGFFPEQVVGGRYQLLKRIGAGAMGEVWEAVQTGVNRPVAVKFLHPSLMMHSTARQRVLKEAEALGRIRHSRVITIFDCFETDDTVALVLEYARGGSLADRIETDGALPDADAVSIMDDMLRGLNALHREGIIHRDIKPDNVLIGQDEDGRPVPKLTDLGIAHNQDGTRLTRDGSRLGTPEYMAPELIRGLPVDTRSDIYACGVVLYEMLVGTVPFAGTDYDIQHGHVSTPPDLARLPDTVSAEVRSALEKALAKDPDERFADCNAFRAALSGEGAIASSVAPAQVPAPPVAAAASKPAAAPETAATPSPTPASTAPAAQVEAPAPKKGVSGRNILLGVTIGILALCVIGIFMIVGR